MHTRTDTIDSHGRVLHLDVYAWDATKPVVVFIPGMGCHAGIYADFLSGLAESGFNVLGIDLPGHGRSSGPRGTFTFDEVISAIYDVVSYSIDRYGEGVGLMGSSLGGTFALYAAMRDERLKAVLCHDVMDIAHDLHVPVRFPRVVRFMIRRLRWLATLMPWLPVPLRVLVDWNHVVERRSLLASLVADRHMVWTYPLRTWSSFLEYAPSTTFANISTPMKIIVGDRDLLFPPDHCRRIAEKIGGNGASFEVLNGGHALPLESIPQTIAVAQRWFGEHLRTGAWDGSIRAEGSTC